MTFEADAKKDPTLDVHFADANLDVSKQLDQIDNFIAQKVNAIVVVPVDYDGIVPGIEKANQAGIPVISLIISSHGGKFTYVGLEQRRGRATPRGVHARPFAERRQDRLPAGHPRTLPHGLKGRRASRQP